MIKKTKKQQERTETAKRSPRLRLLT